MRSRLASGITTMEFLAPPRAWTRLPLAIAREATYWAIVADPTNETASTPSESRRALTASCAPWTRFTTPGGMASIPAISSTMRSGVSGSCSDGLRMIVLPQTMANGMNQSGTMAGKLNGVIAATTPTGW